MLAKIKNKILRLYIGFKKETLVEKNNREEFLNSIKNIQKLDRPDYGGWNSYIKRLHVYISKNDPRSFLRWKPITESMFSSASKCEFDYLITSINNDKLLKAIEETWVGNPPKYKHYKKSSSNFVHTAYNLSQLIDLFKIDVKTLNSIVEFGAGYGCMAKLINNLGFVGKYTIFDIPEFLALQKYYLHSSKIMSNFKFIDKIDKLEAVNPDILISTWSLSESPISLRDKFLKKIGKPKYILIAYQENFNSIDNKKYFETLKGLMSEYEWTNKTISHVPGNYYLLGKKI